MSRNSVRVRPTKVLCTSVLPLLSSRNFSVAIWAQGLLTSTTGRMEAAASVLRRILEGYESSNHTDAKKGPETFTVSFHVEPVFGDKQKAEKPRIVPTPKTEDKVYVSPSAARKCLEKWAYNNAHKIKPDLKYENADCRKKKTRQWLMDQSNGFLEWILNEQAKEWNEETRYAAVPPGAGQPSIQWPKFSGRKPRKVAVGAKRKK